MVDLFLVLVAPGGGDELQGVKRGIMELADLVVVNKADGDLAALAAPHRRRLRDAPSTSSARGCRAVDPRVLTCSALDGTGIDEVWDGDRGVPQLRSAGELADACAPSQNRDWMWSEITDSLLDALHADRQTAALARRLEADVAAGAITPTAAARAVLEALLDGRSPERRHSLEAASSSPGPSENRQKDGATRVSRPALLLASS